jgi:hypothetical protein
MVSSFGRGDQYQIGGFSISGGTAVKIRVFVPKSTPIKVSIKSADVRIIGVAGSLGISIAGSGDVNVDEVSECLEIDIAGSGDVEVAGGVVDNLRVAVAGSGDVKFDGIATMASLSVAGSGDIRVHRVLRPFYKTVAGSGSIKVKNKG